MHICILGSSFLSCWSFLNVSYSRVNLFALNSFHTVCSIYSAYDNSGYFSNSRKVFLYFMIKSLVKLVLKFFLYLLAWDKIFFFALVSTLNVACNLKKQKLQMIQTFYNSTKTTDSLTKTVSHIKVFISSRTCAQWSILIGIYFCAKLPTVPARRFPSWLSVCLYWLYLIVS